VMASSAGSGRAASASRPALPAHAPRVAPA
jgi:hypothetical protein